MALEFVEKLLVADLELVARVREVLLLLVLLRMYRFRFQLFDTGLSSGFDRVAIRIL